MLDPAQRPQMTLDRYARLAHGTTPPCATKRPLSFRSALTSDASGACDPPAHDRIRSVRNAMARATAAPDPSSKRTIRSAASTTLEGSLRWCHFRSFRQMLRSRCRPPPPPQSPGNDRDAGRRPNTLGSHEDDQLRLARRSVPLFRSSRGLTLAISCEAVPASLMGRRGHEPAPPTGHGAGESFVSFIALFGGFVDLFGGVQGLAAQCPRRSATSRCQPQGTKRWK